MLKKSTIIYFFRRKKRELIAAFIFLFVTLLLIGSGIFSIVEFYKSPPYVDPERYPIRGIDVSQHNGLMNLDAARSAGIEFIFIKATEGVTHKDQNFRINYLKAHHAGLKVGAYHFFRFDKDGIDQARNFLEATGNRQLELGLAIDVEDQGNAHGVPVETVISRLRDMVEYMNLKGKRVILYTNRSGYEKYLMNDFAGHPLWICSFSSTPINAEWTFWQYNHHGKVNGIIGDVDLNTFCGKEDEWNNFLAGALWPYNAPPEE